MKPYFLFLILIFSSQLSAQITIDTPQYRYAFKGYLNFSDEKKLDTQTDFIGNISVTNEQNITLLPRIALSKYRKNGQFFELSLTNFEFSNKKSQTENKVLFAFDSLGNRISINAGQIPIRGAQVFTNHFGFRFEWSFPMYKNEESTLKSYIGISTDPSLFFQKIVPFTSAAFVTHVGQLSNTFILIPRLTYSCSKRLFIDVNIPISFLELATKYRFENNPSLPTFARDTFNFTARLPSNFWAIRLGIGYKI